MQVVDASDKMAVDQLTRSGWVPLNSQGHPFVVTDDFQGSGGQVFTDPDTGQTSTLDAVLGGGMTPEQTALLKGFNPSGPAPGQNPQQGTVPAPTPTSPQPMPSTRGFTQTAGNIGPDGLLHFPDADGNEFDPTMIPGLDIEQPGTIPGQFNGAFTTGQMDFMNNLAGQVSNQYNQPLPANPAAQINLGQLPQLQTQQYGGAQAPVAQQYGGGPQPTAQQLGISDELRQLLSGQGLNPATLARMRQHSHNIGDGPPSIATA